MKTAKKQGRGSVRGVWCAGGLALLAASGSAWGQCSVYRLDIPDLDQRRTLGINTAGLAGGGSSHCVPTAAANWLAYIGNHGYPEVLSPRDWQLNGPNYGAATSVIDQLGDLMGTTTDGGTQYANYVSVCQTGLDAVSPGNFLCVSMSMNKKYAPTTLDVFIEMITGDLVSIGSSRWALTAPDPVLQLPQRYVRSTGGHCMTVSRIYDACGGGGVNATYWIRDPANPNDGQTVSQSVFGSQAVTAEATNGLFAETAESTTFYPRLVSRLLDPNNTAKFSVVNTLMIIAPRFGLTADAVTGQISMLNQHSSDDFQILPPHTHSTPGNAAILALKVHPQLAKAMVLTQAPGQDPQLAMFVPALGEFHGLGPIPGAMDLTMGRNGEVLVRKLGPSSTVVVRLDMSSGAPVEEGSVATPGATAMTYDDTTDTLVAVAPTRGMVGFSSMERFGLDYHEIAIPAGVVVGGATTCAVSPVDGTIYVASAGDDAVYALTKVGAGTLTLNQRIATPQTVAPKNLQVDHRGHLVFTSGGVVRELRQNAASGAWEADPTSKFAGVAAPGLFEQRPARSNDDDTLNPLLPAQDVPNQQETGGPSVADCRPDFDGNGMLDVQDIFGFLNGWFGGNLRTDYNFSGTRDVQDIFDYLNAWFAGC